MFSSRDEVDAILLVYFLAIEIKMTRGEAVSSATTVIGTVQSTPLLKYLAILGGAMWLVERFKPRRQPHPRPTPKRE
jgi:hypothetical protein